MGTGRRWLFYVAGPEAFACGNALGRCFAGTVIKALI